MEVSGDGYTRRPGKLFLAVVLCFALPACRAAVDSGARSRLAAAYRTSARDPAGSLEIATELAARHRSWPAPHALAGRLYAIDGEVDRAATSLRTALDLDPADRQALLWYARVAIATGDGPTVADAATRVERALAHDDDDARLHHALGLLFEEKGDVTAALAAYRRGADRLDHVARLHLDAARAYHRLGLADRARASVELAALIAGGGPVGEAAQRLLDQLAAAGRRGETEEANVE